MSDPATKAKVKEFFKRMKKLNLSPTPGNISMIRFIVSLCCQIDEEIEIVALVIYM